MTVTTGSREPEQSAQAELRLLRRRAYGPDADIADDPEALRRLRELEARVTPAAAPVAAPAVASDAAIPPTDAAASAVSVPRPVAADPAPEDPVREDPDPEEPEPEGFGRDRPRIARAGRRGRRLLLVWAASVAVTAVVAGTVSWAVTRRIQADPLQVAVLGSNPDQRLPTVFGVDQSGRRFADFYGLTVFSLTGRGWMSGGGPDDACLILMESDKIDTRSNSYEGEVYAGCGAGSFPATVQLRIGDAVPEELAERFPDGSALQFILGEDDVEVLSDAVEPQG